MSIIPSTTATITVGNVGTTLGNATKNMGGFRGFGGSVPASGALSMSQCQKIQYGVGYYNSWQVTPSGSTNWGSWSATSIATNTSMTCSVWFASTATYSAWRNIFHVAASGAPDFPRYPSFYLEAGGTRILQDCTTGGSYYTSAINHTGQTYHLLITYNGSTVSTYLNGSLAQTNTLTCAIGGTDVYGPDTTYPNFANGSLNYLWFFPYPMTAAQVSTYYNSLSNSLSLGTGGTISFSGGTVIHVFTTSGTFTTTRSLTCQILVVGGGGGAGNDGGGGGGGGGVVYYASQALSGSYTVTVGGGGAGAVTGNDATNGVNGGNSSVTGLTTALGGGGGGDGHAQTLTLNTGGSGGGGGFSKNPDTGTALAPGSGTAGQGNNGGAAYYNSAGGGGGGAGAVGGAAANVQGGTGGIGVAYSISGTSTYYGGGGGGGSWNGSGGAGGTGGGGQGGGNHYSGTLQIATSGTPNIGGGGGGNGFGADSSPGSGGSGIVIIAYTP